MAEQLTINNQQELEIVSKEYEKIITEYKKEIEEEFNIDEYEPALDESVEQKEVDRMNIFMIYYKKLYCKPENTNMFENIRADALTAGTNKQMEMYYDMIATDVEDPQEVYNLDNINIKDFEELYALAIDDDITVVCKTVIPIIRYISDNINWYSVNWNIIPFKSNQQD